jgi:hypothetical protein
MLAVGDVPGVVLQHEESMVVVVSSFAGGDRLVCGYFGGSLNPSSSPRRQGVAAGESRP